MNTTAATLPGYKAQAEILKALAHPVRLLIIDKPSEVERCVFELTDLVGQKMPTAAAGRLRPFCESFVFNGERATSRDAAN